MVFFGGYQGRKKLASSTFVVYIDESGDDGFCFGRGSSEWFVLLTSIPDRDYPYFAMGGLDSELNRSVSRAERKSKFLHSILNYASLRDKRQRKKRRTAVKRKIFDNNKIL